MKDFVEIDGSRGEGGGQVLRTSLSLSAVTGRPLRIEKIRAGREKPGLKRQHLTCVRAVAEICGGKVVGVVSAISDSIAEAEVGIVGAQLRELGLAQETRRVESSGPGNYCYVQLDYERASVVMSSVGTYAKSRKAVAHEVVHAVRDFVKSGKACEKHLADQLLVPLEICVGGDYVWESDGLWEDEVWRPNWKLDVQKETLHYTTNRDVIAAVVRG